ncbi:MAG: hypothetical protein J7J46_06290 [Candidatus Desulfofervidus sp.]|nr:hypothetical protein [Candidatus Desulfofervidus sp.]
MSKIINFRNKRQVTLYECELKGQISDGYWENARPYDHWKIMCRAEAKVGDPLGPNFRPRRAYNFAAKDLIEVVGHRMLFQVKLKILYPSMSYQTIQDLDLLVDCETGEPQVDWLLESAASDQYWKERLAVAKQNLEVTTDQELIDAVTRVIEFTGYNLTELRKDLRDMSRIVNGGREG